MGPQLRELVAAGCIAAAAGCATSQTQRRAVPSYDDFTGRLVQLHADQNGDGRIDQWSYVDGSRPIRGEADTDDDGRIDRWEYFDASSALTVIGTSSRGDGVEDTWTYPLPSAGGEMVVVTSQNRDRAPNHREYFRGATLARTEDDTNGDGRIDKWQRYEGTTLREAGFDTSFKHGRADRRVQYDDKGRFAYIEEDADGDGRFVRVEGAAPRHPNPPGDE